MTSKAKLLARAAGLFAVLGAAGAASAAVEAHRAPKARDLRTLGIDPAVFRRIDL